MEQSEDLGSNEVLLNTKAVLVQIVMEALPCASYLAEAFVQSVAWVVDIHPKTLAPKAFNRTTIVITFTVGTVLQLRVISFQGSLLLGVQPY